MEIAEALAVEVVGGLVAGAVVAIVGWFLLEQRARQEEELDLVERVLEEVSRELAHNAEQADHLVREAPSFALPYPLFDVNGWTIVTQVPVLKALSPGTLEILMKTYNRFRTSNEQHAFVHDLMFGPAFVTAQVHVAVHGPDGELARFLSSRQEQLDGLAERVKELQAILPRALRAVDDDLGRVRAKRSTK